MDTFFVSRVYSNSSLYPVYVGGNYNDNANYGLFYWNANNSASNSNSNLGSRLLRSVNFINQTVPVFLASFLRTKIITFRRRLVGFHSSKVAHCEKKEKKIKLFGKEM